MSAPRTTRIGRLLPTLAKAAAALALLALPATAPAAGSHYAPCHSTTHRGSSYRCPTQSTATPRHLTTHAPATDPGQSNGGGTGSVTCSPAAGTGFPAPADARGEPSQGPTGPTGTGS